MSNIIDGKLVAESIKAEIKEKVQKMKEDLGKTPGLALILVGNRQDSQGYVRTKKRNAENLGMTPFEYHLPEETTQEELLKLIDELNEREDVHGILVQLPVPDHIDTTTILDRIRSDKDVDGLDPGNIGKIAMKGRTSPFISCTPQGCIALLDYYHIPIEGQNVVLLGRSNLVGLPLAMLLIHRNATVTVCHSQTKNEQEIVRNADIVISAVGKPQFIKADWIKEGAVVIDVGINSVDDPTSKKGYKLVGDVDFENVKDKCKFITPVPGGVGPMTITMLMLNTYKSAHRAYYHEDI